MGKNRLVFLSALLLLVVSFLFINACSYITGEALKNTASIPRWVWTGDSAGYSFITDRNTGQPIRDIIPEEAFGIIGTSEYLGNPVVIDVRTPQEYADGHIRAAINIDYNSPAFKDEIGQLDKNKTYIVYCRTGARSAQARQIMEDLGFKYVINMDGGITAWIDQGLPVGK